MSESGFSHYAMPMLVKFYSHPENPENPENPDSDKLELKCVTSDGNWKLRAILYGGCPVN